MYRCRIHFTAWQQSIYTLNIRHLSTNYSVALVKYCLESACDDGLIFLNKRRQSRKALERNPEELLTLLKQTSSSSSSHLLRSMSLELTSFVWLHVPKDHKISPYWEYWFHVTIFSCTLLSIIHPRPLVIVVFWAALSHSFDTTLRSAIWNRRLITLFSK